MMEVAKMEGVKGGQVAQVVEKVGVVGGIENPEDLYAVYCFLLTELYIAGVLSKEELNIRRDIEVQGEFKCLMDYALGFVDALNGVERQKPSPAYRLGYALAKGEKFYYEGEECMRIFTNIRAMLKDIEEVRKFFSL